MHNAGTRTRTTGLVAASLVLGSVITWTLVSGVGQGQPKPPQPVNDTAAIQQAKGLSRAFRSAAKQVMPSVVKVTTTTKPKRVRGGPRMRNPFEGTPFEDLFRGDMPGPRSGMPNQPLPGLGSGVILETSGLVLTNNHVVEGADVVEVQLGDGRKFEVEEIKTDERTDLAVLRLKVDGSLPAAPLGDSDQLEIGDWVIAIGNPFALEQTVSAGIISGKGRTLGSVRRARFLQTDAAINPGNSGGPLVNLDGEVVGINTAIASRTGGYQGIGFAIPINLARWVTRQLIERGTVARAYLGVGIENIGPERAEELAVRPDSGVIVSHVGDDTPAEKAGLREKDVIESFDGKPVTDISELQELVERSAADSGHQLRIVRDGKSQTLEVRVEAMPDDFEVSMDPGRPEGRSGTSEFYRDPRIGLVVIGLTDYLAEKLGHKGLSGVLVHHVDPERLAAQAGLQPGMLIVRVGNKRVPTVADFQQAIEQESLGEGITLEVQGTRGRQIVKLQSS